MKKVLLLMSIVICLAHNTHAQVIEDFESWTPYTVLFQQLTEPTGWSGSDSFVVGYGKLFNPLGTFQAQIFQDNPGQAGTGALRVASKFQDAINAGVASLPAKNYPGICTNSQIAIDFVNNSYSQLGGTALLVKPGITSMYVKNTLVSGDSTFINVLLIDDSDGGDSIIAMADTILTSDIAAYTKITLPFVYNGSTLDPTLVRYTISSGNPLALLDSTNMFSVHDGTEIVIDNIDVTVYPSGVSQLIKSNPVAKVYPTTGSDNIHIDFLKNIKNAELEIYQSNGQIISSQRLESNSNLVSISSLSSGSYIYSIRADKIIYQTGKFVK